MTLSGLSYDQKLALVALLELFAMSDGVVTEGEKREINKIVSEFGDDEYRELMNEADSRFDGVEMLKSSLETIKEKAAQELIYGIVMEEVMSAPATVHPPELLDWLKTEWNIEITDASE
jgi:hypothetical protein